MAKSNKDRFYTERSEWTDYISQRPDFTHAEFRVAYFIASKTNYQEECMWWSVRRIASEAFVSLATVKKTIDKLEALRLVTISKRKNGKVMVNSYAFRMPLDAKDQAFRATKKTREKTGGRTSRVSLNETERVSLNETKPNKA